MEPKTTQITICEAKSAADTALFWAQLHAYFQRDILPDPNDEDRAYFLGPEYQAHIQQAHDRPQDRCHYLFFCRDGKDIGLALPVFFHSEDGKCFLMEFCVYPEFRGHATGLQCAKALLDWAKRNGASYTELNCGGDERRPRFWSRAGFLPNGIDQWGEPLMICPPEEPIPYSIEVLTDPEDWQLVKLENGLRFELGQQLMTEEPLEQLRQAIRSGATTIFLAKRGCRAVGMCQVSMDDRSDTGSLSDLFVEPAFRHSGIARMLTAAAQQWSHEQGLSGIVLEQPGPAHEGTN